MKGRLIDDLADEQRVAVSIWFYADATKPVRPFVV